MFAGGVPPAQPQIGSMNPTSGAQGSSITLTIQGTNLSGAAGISFSPATGITVTNVHDLIRYLTQMKLDFLELDPGPPM